jgi:hypothetical protein
LILHHEGVSESCKMLRMLKWPFPPRSAEGVVSKGNREAGMSKAPSQGQIRGLSGQQMSQEYPKSSCTQVSREQHSYLTELFSRATPLGVSS